MGHLVLNLVVDESAVLTDERGREVARVTYAHRSGPRRAKLLFRTRQGLDVHREMGGAVLSAFRATPTPGPEAVVVAPGPPSPPVPIGSPKPLRRHLERALEEAEKRDRHTGAKGGGAC
jgi:hypothetical protein